MANDVVWDPTPLPSGPAPPGAITRAARSYDVTELGRENVLVLKVQFGENLQNTRLVL